MNRGRLCYSIYDTSFTRVWSTFQKKDATGYGENCLGFGIRPDGIWILALIITSYVALKILLNFSEPHSLSLSITSGQQFLSCLDVVSI